MISTLCQMCVLGHNVSQYSYENRDTGMFIFIQHSFNTENLITVDPTHITPWAQMNHALSHWFGWLSKV